jgi:hypothetical protein
MATAKCRWGVWFRWRPKKTWAARKATSAVQRRITGLIDYLETLQGP